MGQGAGVRRYRQQVASYRHLPGRPVFGYRQACPSTQGFCLADGSSTGFIAEGHKEDASHVLAGDGRNVGIGPPSSDRRAAFTYERHPPVDNRVGVIWRLASAGTE